MRYPSQTKESFRLPLVLLIFPLNGVIIKVFTKVLLHLLLMRSKTSPSSHVMVNLTVLVPTVTICVFLLGSTNIVNAMKRACGKIRLAHLSGSAQLSVWLLTWIPLQSAQY